MKKLRIAVSAALLCFSMALTGCGPKAADSGKGNEAEPPAPASEDAKDSRPGESGQADKDTKDGQKMELQVFAAASMTETLNKIQSLFEAQEKQIHLVYTFDSSGTLKTQIESGAPCDVFISAAQKQMNALEKADLIDTASRFNLVENKVTLAVPQGNPAGVEAFEDLNTDKVSRIALGNADVPVGQYSEELLKHLGFWDAVQDKVSFASNVKEVTTWVKENAADCGIIYATDAYSAGLKVVDQASADEIKTPVIYPAAVTKGAAQPEAAQKFLTFLKGEEARKIFEEVGFSAP